MVCPTASVSSSSLDQLVNQDGVLFMMMADAQREQAKTPLGPYITVGPAKLAPILFLTRC